VPLDGWIEDDLLQAIAAENNLAETAYVVPAGDDWELRWFTPVSEVALCGHATLASAHVLFSHMGCSAPTLNFHTRQSGTLVVEKQSDGKLAMSFPAIETTSSKDSKGINDALGSNPAQLLQGSYSANEFDYVAVFDTQEMVADLSPDFTRFKTLTSRGVIVTAPGDTCDFVSRYFAPNLGIDEDPVTGSAHCLLTPYWSARLGKQKMSAKQVSKRGGDLDCSLESNSRVIISGNAVDYLIGDIIF